MFNISNLQRRSLVAVALLLAATACNPTWNWREVRSSDAPFSVLLPAKPATYERAIDLNGLQVTMSMTAAEVHGASFAIGSIAVPDALQREQALLAMQTAMVRNIGGTVRRQQQITLPGGLKALEIEAIGNVGNSSTPILLVARFISSGQWAIQAIVVGPQKNLPTEAIDTFLGSLKLR
jgi:hypothetical protein